MTVFWNLLLVLLRAILPAVMNRKPDTMEDSAVQPELRDRLRKRIRATWPRAAVMLLLLLAICTTSGCFLTRTKTVYIQPGDPVRIRETIHGAKVWVMDKDGTPVPGVIDIPGGWYALVRPE